MSKFSVAWHEQALANWKGHIECEKAEIARRQEHLDHQLQEVQRYESQIAKAKAEGKTEFDSDRFGMKRAKK